MLNTGDTFKLTDDAIENYGQEWRDIVFRVTSWADHYVPANEFYANRSRHLHGHPGYDSRIDEQHLYDVKPLDTELEFNSSVYDWEIEEV